MTWPTIRCPRDFRDPAKIYADAEARMCTGCGWIGYVDEWNAGKVKRRPFCGKYNRSFPLKCEDYVEKKGRD